MKHAILYSSIRHFAQHYLSMLSISGHPISTLRFTNEFDCTSLYWTCIGPQHTGTATPLPPIAPAPSVQGSRTYTLKEHQWLWHLRFVKSFWFQWKSMKCQRFSPQNNFKWYQPDQCPYPGNIYIEKFTTIGTSELRWDISGLFLDDTDIYGFLCHWHTIIKSAQSCGR